MTSRDLRIPGILAALTALAVFGGAAHAAAADARAIVERSLQAFYYAGADMQAKIAMRLINPQGKERQRDMTLLRLNTGQAGEQRYYIYFHSPSDVKGTSLLVWKYPQQEDDRWIYIPAIKLVKRIAADDKRSSFVGSDFTYEDVSGRDVDDETHVLKGEEDLSGRPVYVIESRPTAAADYARRVSWIDRERGLPLQEEYFDARGEKVRVFSADKVEQVGDHWTVTARTMKNLQTGHRTETVFEQVRYDTGLTDSIFSERYLRNPPRQWIR